MRKLLALLAIAFSCPLVQAQNIEGQIIASQYQYKVTGYSPNTYAWPGGTCNASGPQKQFAFAAGAPVTIVDGTPALTETVTPSTILNNNQTCAISIAPANSHQVPFFIQSGTGGLQEALNQNLTDPLTNTVILDNAWYQSVGAASAAAVIAAAKGGTQLGLVDVTTVPTSFYAWNGSQYVQVSAGGGASAPATTLVYKGTGGPNGIIPATPGVDYVIPSGSIQGTAAGTVPNTSLVLKGSGTPGVAVPGIPGTDYVIPTGNVATATAAQTAGTPCPVGQAPIGVDARWNSITCQTIGSGGGGGPGSALQLGSYAVTGNTVTGAPSLYAITPTMTQAQINSLFSSLSGTNTVFIPAGAPQIGYNFNSQVPHSFRLSDDWFQMPGIACDARLSNPLTITGGLNTSSVGGALSAADIGKTFFFTLKSGFTFGLTQRVWTAKLQAYSSGTATWSAVAPFSVTQNVYYGTDNLAAVNAAMTFANNAFPMTIPTGCQILVNGTIPWNNNQVIKGRHLNTGGFIGRPGADVIATTDTNGQPVNGVGTGLAGFNIVAGTEIDWSLGYNLYAADGTLTVVPPVYRPLYDHSSLAPNPLGPGWLTNGNNGVASTTQNSSVICAPTALGRVPVVGRTIMFPYFTSIFTATVSSNTGAGCAAGFTGTTLSTALPASSQYTQAQAEWFTGTAIQSTTTTIPTAITYPLTLNVTLSTNPIPGWPSNFPQHGHIKICGIEADYMGITPTTITLRKGPTSSAGCTGTTPMAPLNMCAAKNTFGSSSDQPWPVLPSINAGDSTPAGANWFPGECGGNFALAFPTANGNVYAGPGLSAGFLDDLYLIGSAGNSTGNSNNSGGIYIAGNNAPYATDIENLRTNNLQYGMVQGPASSGQHGVGAVGPTGLGNTLRNLWLLAGFPLAFVDFQSSDVSDLNLNSTEISPFDGTPVGSATCLQSGFTLDERTGFAVTVTGYDNFHTYACEPENGSHIERLPTVDVQSSHVSFDTANIEGFPNVFSGDHLKLSNTSLGLPAIDYGTDNDFGVLDGSNSGYITNVWDGTAQMYEWGASAKCSAFGGGQGSAIACGAGDVQGYEGRGIEPSVTGSKPYFAQGGMITPWMWNKNSAFDSQPMTTSGTPDPLAKYWGASATCALGAGTSCTTSHFNGFNGLIYIGPFNQLYDGPYVLDASFRTTGGPNAFILAMNVIDGGFGTCTSPGNVYSGVVNTTTSFASFKAAIDFTGKAGCALQVILTGNPVNDTVVIDRFNFVPQPQQVLLPTATPTIGTSCAGPNAIIGSNSSGPLSCVGGIVVAGSGGTGINQITGDVTAGPGSGSVAATVPRIGGGPVFSGFTQLLFNTAGVVGPATSYNIPGSGQVGTSFAAGVNTVTCTTTPVFNAALGNTQNLTLTTACGTVTSSSITGVISGQQLQFKVCQDSSGSHPFPWPTNFAGFPSVTQTASQCTTAIGFYDFATDTVYGDQYNAAQCVNGAASNVPCGAATRGYFAVPAGTNSTLAVLTSAVVSDSGFAITPTPFAGTLLGVTCNATPVLWGVSATTPGTGFTVETYGTTSTNPECFSWSLINR